MSSKLEETTRYIENKDPNKPLSRYNQIKLLLNKDGYPVQETWDSLDISETAYDRFVEVTPEYEHRPDLLSLKFYGTLYLYWIIAYANGMTDPFAETYVGKKLRIPNRETVLQQVLIK